MKGDIRIVGFITLLYLLIASVFSLFTSNHEFLFYIAVVLLLAFLIFRLHQRIGLTEGMLWTLSAWGLLHMIGGIVPVPTSWPINGTKYVFYSLWLIPDLLKFDHIVHAYGFGVATSHNGISWSRIAAAVSCVT